MYVGQETPMTAVLNLHYALQQQRQEALRLGTSGPRIMVVGPADVGKTCLAKTLVNYAARNAYFPILCDIDPSGVLVESRQIVLIRARYFCSIY